MGWVLKYSFRVIQGNISDKVFQTLSKIWQMSSPSGKMFLGRQDHILVVLILFDLLVKSIEMSCYVESSHAHLGMGVWFAARYFHAAMKKILFFSTVCIILQIAMQTQALLPSKLLIKGLIKLSPKSKEFRKQFISA